ncbi:MAG: ABC transporter permease [Actinobacteria bacterium]|nr:ABC transporter permease [Actinomycetota bacterium]
MADLRQRMNRLTWPILALPSLAWLALFLAVPFYVVLCVAFGAVDPLFRTPVPVWNPLEWRFEQVVVIVDRLFGPNNFYLPPVIRTVTFVIIAVVVCLIIAFPVAYYAAKYAGRRKALVLTLIVAPFWISYMMRMLAWVNLLQTDGIVNSIISLGGLLPLEVNWLSGKSYTVVMGLIYGYLPYMILPLFAALDRINPSLLEAARDLGAGGFDVFRRVIVPMSIPGIAAGILLVALPMMGDYFTTDMLSGSPETSMIGNLINTSISTPGQSGQAAALLLLVLLVLAGPMIWYTRSMYSSEVRT